MRCRGVLGIANAAYLEGFPFPALLRVAPYCAPGGIRVVSTSPVNSPDTVAHRRPISARVWCKLTPFGALRASSTIHVRPLGGSPPPSVALLVHQLREGLAPLGQCQVSALRR